MPCPRCGQTDSRCETKAIGWVWCHDDTPKLGWQRHAAAAATGPAFYMPTAATVGTSPSLVAIVGANHPQSIPCPPSVPTQATPPVRTAQATPVPQENRATRGLMRWLTRRGGRCTPRDLQRANARYRTRLTAEIALNNLVELGLVVKTRYRPPTGGHSVPVFIAPDDSIAQPTHDRFS
jgi:hypothetical protein